MKIKEVPMDGFNAYFYKTKKYSTIHINLFFEIKQSKQNIYLCDLLEEYMLCTSKNYKTEKELTDKSRELYTVSGGLFNHTVGNKIIVEMDFTFFDPKLVDDDYFKDALDFAYERIYNPNFTNGKLDKSVLKKVKNNLIGYTAEKIIHPQSKASSILWKTIAPNTFISYDIIETKKEYEDLLDSFTDEDLIKMYHEIVDNSFIGMTIMGNLDDRDLENIKNTFKFKNIKKYTPKRKELVKINDKEKYIKISDEDLNESILYNIYTCKKYRGTQKDKNIFKAIKMILNYDTGRLIHKTLRDEMQIVYNASASFMERAGIFTLRASIDSKNEQKCLEGFDKLLEKLKDEKFLEEELAKIRTFIEKDMFIYDENKYNLLNSLINMKIFKNGSLQKQQKLMSDITAKDIIETVKVLEAKVTYFYEGVKK